MGLPNNIAIGFVTTYMFKVMMGIKKLKMLKK